MNETLFYLLKCVVSAEPLSPSFMGGLTPDDWQTLFEQSKKQGVSAVVFDKIQSLPKEVAPPRNILIGWYSQALYVEQQLKKMFSLSAEYADKMYENDLPVVVLKGLSFGAYYPNPMTRECGDLDCYMMGKGREGDRITALIGGKVEDGGYKHAHLHYKGLTIENHYYLTNFNNTKRGIYTERYLQQLIEGGHRQLAKTHLLSPSADFNAFFLIKHALMHFICEGINLRHLLDWAFFLQKEQESVDWENLVPEMEKCRIIRFAQVMTEMCVEFLGMDISVKSLRIPSEDGTGCALVHQVMQDIMDGHPDISKESFLQKCFRILRRFGRMWRYRSLASESYWLMVWNTFSFSSYLKRKVKLE